MKLLDIKKITSALKSQDPEGNEIPLLEGSFIDYNEIDSDDLDALDVRQNTTIKALKDTGLTDKPMMAFDIAPPNALKMSHEGKELTFKEEKGKYAKVIVPCSQIVDITNLKPKMGESAIRCNPAFPQYRWFQAINAILSYQNNTEGRVVPFPLKTEDENGKEEMIYHAMRVNKVEYEAYQKLLIHSCQNDGTEMGFYHAAKFAYEILHKRGFTELTSKDVGDAVTKITMMGRPQIKAVVVYGATHEDFQGKIRTGHFVYST
jgi:hypothetical protein